MASTLPMINWQVKQAVKRKPLLADFTLTLPAGRTLGVLGRTGSGKTTLTRLLLRFYDPQAGNITLGDVDLHQLTQTALRRHVGLVTQEVQSSTPPCATT